MATASRLPWSALTGALVAAGCLAALAGQAVAATGAPLPPSDYVVASHLEPGDQGPAVELLQITLDDEGAQIPVTGVFDAATTAAVERIARQLGLPTGDLLLDIIGLGFTPAALPIGPGSSPVQIRALQNALSRAGFPVPVTGVFDGPTASALLDFERSHQLPASPTLSLWQVESLLPLPALASSSPTPPPPTSLGLQIAVAAERLLGKAYLWGAAGPDAFDCSGLVEYVYAEVAHLNLPHASAEQFALGRAVTIAQLQPGDLVFFDTDGPGPSHVGIYTGYGQFISATDPQGGVQWGSIWTPYWYDHFVGARSLLPAAPTPS